MKKLFIFLLLGVFLLSFTSALELDNIKKTTDLSKGEYLTIGERQVTDYVSKYPQIEVKNFFGLGETLFKGVVTKHTDSCGTNCLSELEVYIPKDGVLVEDVLFKRSFDNQNTWVDWTGFTNWNIQIENKNRYVEQDVYETQCEKTGKISINATEEEICYQIKTGTETIDTGEWKSYNLGSSVEAGNYKIKLVGSKKGSTILDWQIKTSGVILDDWAVWGNISLGDDAEVILNSPANDSTALSNSATFNATANVTGGVYLTNMSFCSNLTSSWECGDTVLFGNRIIEENLTEVSSNVGSFALVKTINVNSYINKTTNELKVSSAGENNIGRIYFYYTDDTSEYVEQIGTTTSYVLKTYDNPNKSKIVEYIEVRIYSTGGANPNIYERNTKIYGIETNNINTIFSRTITDTTLWNVQACDSDGDCGFAPSNYTVNLDVTAPTIEINAGNGTQDYGTLTQNHTINFTVTDDNLDECWYEYNETNSSAISCSTGILKSINFSLVKDLYNATIYSNDTAGNLQSEVVEWDYKVFENSFIYNNETRAGDQEDFSYELTLHPDYDLTSAIFHYNGLTVSPAIYSNGNQRVLNITNYEIPTFTTDTNISIWFELFLDDLTSINTTNQTQLVQAIFLDNCSSYTNQLFNISLFDEVTQIPLNGDIQFYYNLLNVPAYETISTISLSLTNSTNFAICSDINLTNQNYVHSVEIRYVADGYVPELYHIQRAEITPETRNISLYSLNQSDSTEFKITYQDDTFNFVEGAIVQLQRRYISEDAYKTVEAPITSNEGIVVLHIDLDSIKYRVVVVKNGEVLDTFDNIVFKCQSELTGECEQKLLGEIDPQNTIDYDTERDFTYSVTAGENNITVTYTIPSLVPASINIVLTQKDEFGNETKCNKTVVSSGGSIVCEYDETLGTNYLELKISKNGVIIAQNTYVIDEETGMDFLDNNYIIVVVLMLSLVGLALASPEWIIVNSVITLLLSGMLWLVNGINFVMGLGLLMWLVIAAGIIILKLSKQEDR